MVNDGDTTNGWIKYQKLVLSELERHETMLINIQNDISTIKTEIATLKVKSGMWGAVSGTVVVLGAILLKFIGL